jgi:hypothetical protein
VLGTETLGQHEALAVEECRIRHDQVRIEPLLGELDDFAFDLGGDGSLASLAIWTVRRVSVAGTAALA